jgi:hypothetical protein
MAGVRGGRTHPGLPRSPATVLKTAGTTGHHPLPHTILRAITVTLLLRSIHSQECLENLAASNSSITCN